MVRTADRRSGRAAAQDRKPSSRAHRPRRTPDSPSSSITLTTLHASLIAHRNRVRKKISAEWRRRFTLLPGGYCPIATADAGDWFDEHAAERAVLFIQCLKHVKGGKGGQPFLLEPWQKAVVGCMFGWKRADGLRRYREVFLYVAKKNGKSALAAAIVLYLLVADKEKGPEVYSAAASRDQAAIIFAHAAGMVRQEPELKDILKVLGDKGGGVTKSIVWHEAMGAYKCLSADADTADGVNPSGIIVDELHRHKKPELSEVLHKSTAARSQPLTMYTTTADYDRPSVCNQKLRQARQVCENGGDPGRPGYLPTLLPVIFEAPRFEDELAYAVACGRAIAAGRTPPPRPTLPTERKPVDYSKPENYCNPDVWRAANPNLNVTATEDFLATEAKKAVESPTELNNFLRLHLNIVTKADTVGIRMDRWDACGRVALPPRPELRRRRCIGGLDIGATSDLNSLVLLFDGEEAADEPEAGQSRGLREYDLLCWFWAPEEKALQYDREGRAPYTTWARQGLIELTPGDEADYALIHERIRGIMTEFPGLEAIAADKGFQGAQLCQDLERDGIDVVPFGMGYWALSAPSIEFETLVNRGLLHHGNNPVLRWMASNVAWRQDPAAVGRSMKPIKAAPNDPACKIDGIVSIIISLGESIRRVRTQSVYTAQRGLITL